MHTDTTRPWIEEWLAGILRGPAAADPARRVRQERFALARIVTSLTALASLPASLLIPSLVPSLMPSAPSLLTYGAALSLAPLAAVFVLARSGRLLPAQALVSAGLALFAALSVTGSGLGTGAAALALLAVPLDALLAAGVAAAACAGLLAAILAGILALLAPWFAAVLEARGLAVPAVEPGSVLAVAAALAIGHGAARAAMDRRLDRILGAARERAPDDRADAHPDSLALSAIGDLVTWHDAAGAVLRANGASTRLLGASASCIQGHGLFHRIHVADRPAFLKAVSDAAHGDGEAEASLRLHAGDVQGSCQSQGPGHRMVHVEMRLRRLAIPDDGRCAVLAVSREIGAHLRQAQDVETARQDAATADADRARMLATVSHELRTPLNAIVGYAEILMGKGGPALQDRRESYAHIIHQSGQHMLGVVDTLQDLSSIEAGRYALNVEAVDLPGLVAECCALVALPAEAGGVALRQDLASGLPLIVADRGACRQILLNLLSNAVKFTPRGGEVVVEARREGDAVLLAVRDTGIGVSETDLPHLGRPFFRGSAQGRAAAGTGLGLSVVRGLVALHRGRFRVSSATGGGTCVAVHLPVEACIMAGGIPAAAAPAGRVPAARAAEGPLSVVALKTG